MLIAKICLTILCLSYSSGEREERLQKVMEQMISQPPETRIHFEMASFTDTKLLENLFEYVIPFADSIGMNEQVIYIFKQVVFHFILNIFYCLKFI